MRKIIWTMVLLAGCSTAPPETAIPIKCDRFPMISPLATIVDSSVPMEKWQYSPDPWGVSGLNIRDPTHKDNECATLIASYNRKPVKCVLYGTMRINAEADRQYKDCMRKLIESGTFDFIGEKALLISQ